MQTLKTFTGGTKLETQDQELEDDATGDERRLNDKRKQT